MHPTQKPATSAVTSAEPDGSDWSPAHTLRSTALYLERHGWIQGAYYDATQRGSMLAPSACLVGAIGICVHGQAVDNPEFLDEPGFAAFDAARSTLVRFLDRAGDLDDGDSLGDWNDEPDRTAEQVIEVCRYAADAYDCAHTTGGAA